MAGIRQLQEQIGDFADMAIENPVQVGLPFLRKQGADLPLVHFAESAQPFERLVLLSRGGLFSHGQKLLRGLAHCGNDHHGFAGKLAPDDSGDAFNGGGRFHGGAAEFHDNHFAITFAKLALKVLM